MPRSPAPTKREKETRSNRRKRSRSSSRGKIKERRRSLERDREGRSRDRRRSRSRSRSRESSKPSSSRIKYSEKPNISEADLEGKSPEEIEMMKTMGFCGFETTKGKKVSGNDPGEVHVILKRKYRQYMNRKGGFNRPLDFVA